MRSGALSGRCRERRRFKEDRLILVGGGVSFVVAGGGVEEFETENKQRFKKNPINKNKNKIK